VDRIPGLKSLKIKNPLTMGSLALFLFGVKMVMEGKSPIKTSEKM
jgi:hypothetical protein